jgi:hypothetical protein
MFCVVVLWRAALAVAAGCFVLLPSVLPAQGTFDPTGYSSSARFVAGGYDRQGSLTNFPVLIKLSTNLPGFRYTQCRSSQGADVRFVDASNNELNSEIELWKTNGESVVWVQLPILSRGSSVRMFWGKPGLSVPAYRTNGATFNDPGFTAVWHMQTNYVTDSTGHGYKAKSIPVPIGVTPTTGLIGQAQQFNGGAGNDNRILISQSLRLTNQTLSAWIWLTDASREGVVLTKEGQMFFWQQGNQLRFETAPWGGDTTYAVASAGGTGKWIHFAAVQSGVEATLFVNGGAVGSWTKSAAPSPGSEWFAIGGGWGRLFNGRIDECRAENTARSEAWIQTCYQNQISPETFWEVEPDRNYLQASRADAADLRLSWADHGEKLQTSPSLTQCDAWTTNGLPEPAFDGESNHVTVPMPAGAAFFRLAAPRKDFQLQLSGSSLLVTQGLANGVQVSVTGINGFSNTVSLGASNVPSGLTAWFNPASLRNGSGTLTLDAGLTAAPGTYSVTVTGAGGANFHSASLAVTVVAEPLGAPYAWPKYDPDLNYNFTNEYSAIPQPTNILNDCSGVTTTITLPNNWFCFRFGADKHSLVTSNAWVPLLERLNKDFAYFRDVMGWPPDKRAKQGYYSAVYLHGSGTCTGGQSNDLGGWQSATTYNGQSWPMGLLTYYPVYSFDRACPYSDKVGQQGACVHEMIHSVLADMPGCKNACWFHEGGNTWLQGTAEAQRSGDYSAMGWLSAGAMEAQFMPIECYSGWLQDGSFGGPCAEGVNRFDTNGTQICTWRNMLGGTQYGETFPHFMGEIVSPGSVAWIWRNCAGRVLEGLATAPGGLGEYQTRRLIREYRARAAMCDFGLWSAAYRKLLDNTWGAVWQEEWSPYWIDCAPWTARCYVVTTNSAGTLRPESRTLPGWSGANQIPLTTSSATDSVTVNFTPLGTNLSCQLVYRATDNSVIYGKPVPGGACSITPPTGKPIKNKVVVAVICNTDFIYLGEYSRTNKFDYRLSITGLGTSGVTGTANIATKWYQ